MIPQTPEWMDINYNEDYTRITSTRFIIQAYEIKDTNADRDMMVELRKVAKEAPFNTEIYYPFFVLFDQVSHFILFYSYLLKPSFIFSFYTLHRLRFKLFLWSPSS